MNVVYLNVIRVARRPGTHARADLMPQRVWTHKGGHAAALDLRPVPGVGAEVVLSVNGEWQRTRLYRAQHEQAELMGNCGHADAVGMMGVTHRTGALVGCGTGPPGHTRSVELRPPRSGHQGGRARAHRPNLRGRAVTISRRRPARRPRRSSRRTGSTCSGWSTATGGTAVGCRSCSRPPCRTDGAS
jgi:hypothetical protein